MNCKKKDCFNCPYPDCINDYVKKSMTVLQPISKSRWSGSQRESNSVRRRGFAQHVGKDHRGMDTERAQSVRQGADGMQTGTTEASGEYRRVCWMA